MDFIFLGSKITVDSDCSPKIRRSLLLGRKAMTNLNSAFWQRPISQSYDFSNSHIRMWELDHKEGWSLKNWCFQIVVLEKTLENLLDSKEIKSVNPKGNQPWIFIGRTDARAEASKLWPPDAKSQLIGKYPDVEKDWGWEEKRVTEDEMVGWNHWLSEHESEKTLGDSEG